jgi:hypothetical protein
MMSLRIGMTFTDDHGEEWEVRGYGADWHNSWWTCRRPIGRWIFWTRYVKKNFSERDIRTAMRRDDDEFNSVLKAVR